MADQTLDGQAHRGLAGVVVGDTSLGGVDGEAGFFHYRQYDATELAARATFEQVWHLVHRGSLPTPNETRAFGDEMAMLRGISGLEHASRSAPPDAPALRWLRTGVSWLSHTDGMASWLASTRLEDEAARLVAATPTLVAAMWRARHGDGPVPPTSDRPLVDNFLWMLEGAAPEPDRARALEQYLILTMDHGFNASTFAARVIASTGADIGASVTGAIAALSGPLHGGAPALVVDMLQDIGSPDRAGHWARTALAGGGVIMGFGHRVYRTDDPRSRALRDIAVRTGGPMATLAVACEPIILAELERHKPGHRLRTNVEYYAGALLADLRLPPPLFPALFAISRMVGWTAHVLEQIGDNRIMRPRARYIGRPAPAALPDWL